MEPITITLRNTARSYLEIIFHRKWLLIVPVIFITLLAWGYSYTITPMYQSTAVIEVDERAKENPYIKGFSKSTPIRSRLGNILERIKSRSMIEDIVKELNLNKNIKNKLKYRELIETLRRNVSVNLTRGRLLKVTCSYSDKNDCQKIVNLLTRKIIKENLDLQDKETESGIEWIEKEMEFYKKKMVQSEDQLRAFKEKYAELMPEELVSQLYSSITYQPSYSGSQPVNPPFPKDYLRTMGMRGSSIYSLRYQNYSEQLLNQGVKFKELQRKKDMLLKQLANEDEFVISQRVTETNPVIRSLRQELVQKQVKLAKLMVDSTEEHPIVKRLSEEIENLQKTIQSGANLTIKEQTSSLNPIYQAARTELAEVERNIAALEERIEISKTIAEAAFEKLKQLPEKQKELSQLTRDTVNHSKTYSQLLQKRELARVTRRLEIEERGTKFRILDNAEVPIRPYKPKRNLIVIAGFFLGVVLGGGLIVLAETTDHSFEEANQLREFLPVPMLGATSMILTPEEKSFLNSKKRLAFLALLVVVTFIVLTVIIFMIFGQV
jgi:protein tyrosine kinase modulator